MPNTLTARWLFPVDGPPLSRATITIDGNRITHVDKAGARTADIDLGNVAILPGFVNAHTHLDLSDALGKCPPTPDFTAWLRAVVAHRRGQTPQDVARAIEIGLSQCLRYGTTLVGDIAATGASWDQLVKAPLRATVYHELIGLSPERLTQAMDQAETWLKKRTPSEWCRAGLSPHAPYSVNLPRFLEEVRKRPPMDKLPLAIHFAETTAELELLKTRSGPFADFLRQMGAWYPEGLLSGPDQVVNLLQNSTHTAFVHCNYHQPQRMMKHVIYCPRTHAAFHQQPHPFRELLARGTRVAFGTDSLASNPDLDVLAEARLVHRWYPDVPGEVLLRMATLHGAETLTWEEETGSLTPGKSADLVVLPLAADEPDDPHGLLFESGAEVQRVMFRGKWVR